MKPIFEIISKDITFKIYEDGRTEGFSKDSIVINRIPVRIASAYVDGMAKIKRIMEDGDVD
jgi:hypothetical protein